MRAEELQRLASKAKAGDKKAYEQLFEATKNLIYGRVRKYVFDQSHLDDAVQEVCIAIIKSLGGYDETKPFLPWLVFLIKSRTIDYNRRHGQVYNNIISLDINDFDLASYNDDVNGLLEQLKQAMSHLPERQRQILIYNALGFKQEEIAERLNIKIGTVKSQLHKARKQAKKEYEKLGGFVAVALWKVYEAEAAEMPAQLSAQILAQSANVAISSAAATGIMAKLALMGTGAKAAVISTVGIVVIASVGIPIYQHNQNQQAIQAALIIQQQEDEAVEQARQETEAEAARIAAERAEAESNAEEARIVEEQAEAARLEAEAQAAEEAEQAEQARQEQNLITTIIQLSEASQAPPTASVEVPRAEEQPEQSAPDQSNTAPQIDDVSVNSSYKSGLSREEVHNDINALIAKYSVGLNSSGSITSDGVSPIGVSVRTNSNLTFSLEIYSWRGQKTENRADIAAKLKATKAIMQYLYGSKPDASLFEMHDDLMCDTFTSLADYGFTEKEISDKSGVLTHTATGVKIVYTNNDTHMTYTLG